MLKQKKARFNKKLLIAVLSVLLLISAVAAVYLLKIGDEKSKSDIVGQSDVEIAQQDINLDPPSEAVKTEADIQKDKIIQNSANSSRPTENGNKVVNPVITYAQQDGQTVTVNSYVSGVIEDGGECTAKFVKESLAILKTSQGISNAGNTVCAPIFVAATEFKSYGDWNLTIAYKSTSAAGISTNKILNIR